MMFNNIFDSHAHYENSRFDPDRDDVLANLPGQGVRYVLNAGSSIESSAAGAALAAK